MQGRMTVENKMMRERGETTFQQSELHCRAKKLCQSEGHIRDPKIRGGEGQDGNGSVRGKLSQVPLYHQTKMRKMSIFTKDGDVNNSNFVKAIHRSNDIL